MSRPPWRLVLVKGSDEVADTAMVFCIHHGAADGVRAVRFLEAIASTSLAKDVSVRREAEPLAEQQRSGIGHAMKCAKKLLSRASSLATQVHLTATL